MTFLVYSNDGNFNDCVPLDIMPGKWNEAELIPVSDYWSAFQCYPRINYWDLNTNADYNNNYTPKSYKT